MGCFDPGAWDHPPGLISCTGVGTEFELLASWYILPFSPNSRSTGLTIPAAKPGAHGQSVPAGRCAGPVGVVPRRVMRRRLPWRHMNAAMTNAHTANRRRPTTLTIDGTNPS